MNSFNVLVQEHTAKSIKFVLICMNFKKKKTETLLFFQARHIETAAMRALKVIKIEPGDDFNIIRQEIALMAQCRHVNIISYFGSYLK